MPKDSNETTKLVEQGWLVEPTLMSGSRSEAVFFTVGEDAAAEAEIAVPRPGMLPAMADSLKGSSHASKLHI